MVMPLDAIRACHRERLTGWAARLTEAKATAILLVGVGQRPETLGELHVVTVEEEIIDRATIRRLLIAARRDQEA